MKLKQHTLRLLAIALPAVCCFSCTIGGNSSSTTISSITSSNISSGGSISSEEISSSSEVISSSVTSEDISSSSVPTTSITPIVIYNEPEDSLDGVDENDLSHLKNAFENIASNYTILNRSHFNDAGFAYYQLNYGDTYSQSSTRISTDKYLYTLPNIDEYKTNGDIHRVYFIDGENITYATPTEDLRTLDIYNPEKKEYKGTLPFSLSSLDEEYMNNHAFKRVSVNKYVSEDIDSVNDFLSLTCPNYDNEGYYMTFKKVSIELDDNDNIHRIRIYASSTQIGKLYDLYTNKKYTNWYLMFSESIVSNIGTSKVNCLEK